MTSPPSPIDPTRHWTAWPVRRPKLTLLLWLLLLGLCALSLSRVRPDASLARMFPRNDPAAQSLLRVLDHFSAVEELLLLATLPDAASNPQSEIHNPQSTLLSFANRLEQSIASSPTASALTAGVLYRADPEIRAFFEQVLVPHALFYLDDPTFAAAQQRLTRDAMAAQIKQQEALLATPGPAAQALSKAFLQDPLRLHEFLLPKLLASRPFQSFNNSDAFLSPDGRSLLIRIRGTRPPGDIDFSTAITNTIQQLATETNTDHLTLQFTGAYAIAATSARAIRSDLITNVTSTVILIQLLFLLAYRRPFRTFALTFTPVAAGIVAGLGLYTAFSPSLTPLTAVIGGILAGMGIDYSLHYLSHHLASLPPTPLQSERGNASQPLGLPDAPHTPQRPKSTTLTTGNWQLATASAHTSRTLLAPSLAACLTTLLGFAAIALSPIPALRDFATLATLGLSLTLLATYTLLPALLTLLSPRPPSPHLPIPPSLPSPSPQLGTRNSERTTSPYRLPLLPALLFLTRHRRASLTLSVLLALAALSICLFPTGPLPPLLPLEPNLASMHPTPNPALEAQSDLAARMGTAADTLLVHLRADSPDQLVELAHAVDARLQSPAAKDAGLTSTFGLATLLPNPALTPKRLAATGPQTADRVLADFHAAIADSLFAPDAFAPYTTFLRHLLTRTTPPTLADLLPYRRLAETILPTVSLPPSPLPHSPLPHLPPPAPHPPTSPSPHPSSLPTESLTHLFLRTPLSTRESRDHTISTLRTLLSDLPSATLSGMPVVAHDTERVVRHDLPRFFSLSLAAVATCMLLHFRSIRLSLLAFLPTAYSLLILLAASRLTHQTLNVVNLAALPILIGLNVDYGIYLVSLTRPRRHTSTIPSPLGTGNSELTTSPSPHPLPSPPPHPPSPSQLGTDNRDLTTPPPPTSPSPHPPVLSLLAPSAHAILLCAATTTLGFGSLYFTSVPAIQSLGFAVATGLVASTTATFLLLLPLLTPPSRPAPAPPAPAPSR